MRLSGSFTALAAALSVFASGTGCRAADTSEFSAVYTFSAREYSEKLKAAYSYGCADLFRLGDDRQNAAGNAERTLLVHFRGSLGDENAIADICDRYNIHTLVYKDRYTADAAFERYLSKGMDVCRDELLTAAASDYLSWGPAFIGVPEFTGRMTAPAAEGPEIRVAVIDTGIDSSHSFLNGRIDTESGYDFCSGDSDPQDDNNHGTHVAGIIADSTPANVKLVPIKSINGSGSLTYDNLKAGLEHALNIGADIVNLSLASTVEDAEFKAKKMFSELFQALEDNNIIVCAAAGNARAGIPNNADYIFPANMENAITAASISSDFKVPQACNYGSVIDVAAPGVEINSTIRGGRFAYMSGTSSACPFVSACAALLLCADNSLTSADVRAELRGKASPFPDNVKSEYYEKYGVGILDLRGFYPAAASPAPSPYTTDIPIPTPDTAPEIRLPVTLNVQCVIDGGNEVAADVILDTETEGKIIAVQYDESGRLSSIQIKDTDAKKKDYTFILPYNEGNETVILLWDRDMSKCLAYAASAEW